VFQWPDNSVGGPPGFYIDVEVSIAGQPRMPVSPDEMRACVNGRSALGATRPDEFVAGRIISDNYVLI
jgi:hypothetical protein